MAEKKNVRDRGVVIDDAFGGMQRWGIRIVVIAAAAVVIGWVIGTAWIVLFPIAMALIVSTILAPPVTWLRTKGWPSGLAAAAVVLGFIGIVVGLIAILTPQVAGQSGEVAAGATDGLQKVRDWLTEGPLGLSEGQITRAIEALQDKVQASAAAIGSGVFSTIGAATSAIVNLILVLMLSFFFVKDGHKFLPWAKNLGGKRAGEHTAELLERTWDTLGGFIRTQSLVALIDAVIIGTGMVIIGVPLAIPLAVLTFFGAYIPIIGAFISGALAVLVTLVTNGPQSALIVLIIVVAVQQLEGNVLSPYLQGKNMNLHAAIVLLSVTAGGTLFGVTGAFLAVPVAASTAEILRYINERIDEEVSASAPKQDSEAADDPEG
ncbi:MAG: AI-2E family transporter [Actinomycetota bacterium]|nr:AI-2E family transporter [Actinomycetota bacterium]